MLATASCSQANEDSDKACSSRSRKTAIAFVLGNALVVSIVSAGVCSDIDYENSAKTAMRTVQDSIDSEPRRIQLNAEAMRATVVGTASMYNPYRPGYNSGGPQTASGEMYDPAAWTAAIQIDLRDLFSGVRYGKNYRPTYALVECVNKRAIVKINDVGPLKPGRVIDLDEQSMRYFDPSLQAGLIHDVKITLLAGEDWTPGPVGSEQPISVAAEQLPGDDRTPEPIAGQKLANVFAEQLPGEDRAPEPIGSRQPISVAAEQLPDEDRAPEPIGGQQLANVFAEQLPSEDRTPEPIGSRQIANVIAEQSSGENWTPGPIGIQQRIGVSGAPYRVRYPSHKMEVIVAQSIMIGIIAMLLKLPAAAPTKASGAESHAARARPRNRRKNPRESQPKSRRKDSRKSQSKRRRKT